MDIRRSPFKYCPKNQPKINILTRISKYTPQKKLRSIMKALLTIWNLNIVL